MKKEVEGWLFFADKDMLAANILIQQDETLTGSVTFHCQQAIEKYFKAYLLEHGKKIRRNHDLISLYAEVKTFHDWNIDEALLEKLSDMYIESHYPDSMPLNPAILIPAPEEAQRYLDFARHVETIFKGLMEM